MFVTVRNERLSEKRETERETRPATRLTERTPRSEVAELASHGGRMRGGAVGSSHRT